jgi:biopolymer transport protein ExbB
VEESSFSLLELFSMGGPFMWPLLLFSIATIALALERALYLSYHNLNLDDLKAQVSSYLTTGNMTGAKDYLTGCTKRRPGARVLLCLVNHRNLPENQIEKAMEAEALTCINTLESGFNFLTALGSLSPLTGFLGTVSGMIGAFKSIAEAENVNAQIVASGIYEALITTVFGLIIAIIAMIAHSLLSHIVDKFAANTEKTCSDLIMDIVRLNAAGKGKPDQMLLPSPKQKDVLSLEEYT